MNVKILKNQKDFYTQVEENKDTDTYYLIEKPNQLKTYLEDSGIKEELLIKTKLAYNLKFSGYILRNDNSKIEVNSIFDTISKLSSNYINHETLIINIESNIGNTTSEEQALILDLTQQFIFLDLEDLEIYTNHELKNKILQKNFDLNKEKIKNAIIEFEKDILQYETEDKELKKSKKNLQKELEEISKIIKKTDERKIIISVIAKRNAGKSVIVNSFLGEEFAPTSQEDSTPNAVSYETWDKNYIEVKIEKDENHPDYKEEIVKEFKGTKEVYEFLKNEFKKVNDSELKYMPDIYVKYPGNRDYIIVDTPGPNKNAEHKNVSEKWLKKSDAVLFAFTYGDNEEKESNDFLERVRDELLKENKLQSLVIIANKLDLMYSEKEVSKIKNRYLDKALTYLKDTKRISVMMMASSALEYFYMIEFQNIIKHYGIESTKLSNIFDETIDLNLNDEENTIVTFIENQTTNYKRFYKKKSPTIEDIIKHSNMETIIRKVENIARNKAFSEIFSYLFGQLDSKFTKIENEFLITKCKDFENQKEAILQDINDIKTFFDIKRGEINRSFSENNMLNDEIKSQINTLYNDISKDITDAITEPLDKSIKDEVRKKETKSVNMNRLLHEELKTKIESKFPNTQEQINKEKEKLISGLEEELEKLNEEIKNKIKSKEFDKQYNFKIQCPTLPQKLQQDKFQISFDNFDKNLKKYERMAYEVGEIHSTKEVTTENKREIVKDGFLNRLKSWSGLGTPETETVTDKYTETLEIVDDNKVDTEMETIKSNIIDLISTSIESDKKTSEEDIKRQISKFQEDIKDESHKIISYYAATQNDIKDFLDKDKDTLDNQIKFYKEITNSFKNLKEYIDEIKEI